MVGSSKILTVSYGTFSCTLEGFDDSFNTMKAIAEYFRGLASDDRYFGAEPPTPDAEMLASIAEREISRRVDASMEDSGIVLRAAALTDQSDAPSDAMAEDAADNAPQHDKESRAEVDAARKAAKAERKAEKQRARAERDAEKAAKAEARAKEKAEKAEAKAKADAEAKAVADAKAEAEAQAEADAAEAAAEASDDTSILSSVSAATADASEGTSGTEVEEARNDAPSSMLAAKDPAPTNSAPAHPDADSVAAKLQRIRAVVGDSEEDENAATDDLSAQFLPQTETPDVADFDAEMDASSDLSDDPVADFDAHEAEMEVAEQAADDADANTGGVDMIGRVMARNADAADTDAVAETDSTNDAPLSADDQPNARVIRMKRADFEQAVQDGEIEPDSAAPAQTTSPDFGLLDGADELDEYLEDSDFVETDLSDMDDADLAEDLAAITAQDDVIDIAQAEDDHEVEVAAMTDNDEESEAEDASDNDAINAVSNAMAAQIDAVQDVAEGQDASKDEDTAEAESGDAPEVDVAQDPEANAANDDPAHALLAQDAQVDDAALDRLMSETDVQMQEPESSRRRDAISQLKAAVAAKEAARQVGETDDDGQDVENAFRNDLSEAVRPEGHAPRPRPVVRSSNRTERPRPAPLKLVAAQRVDLSENDAQRDGPVVPRRVAATRKDSPQQQASGSFAEFAENMGASELPDLLEAAAAYTSFVEGADEFSRPQILRRARAAASDDFNREDGLRSFADLLRAGRFTKVRNGRFQVADDSRFNPERRAS